MSTRRLAGVTPTTPAWLDLAAALEHTATPCKAMPEWTSDDPEDRAVAARACRSCPLLELCHAAAESTCEPFGVWAGIDRERTPTTRKRTA